MQLEEYFVEGFTNYIIHISRKYNCLYSANLTGGGRTVQNYTCCLGGRIRSQKGIKSVFKCLSYVNLKKVDGFYSFLSSEHNHDTCEELLNSRRCSLSVEELQLINYYQELGLSPMNIRFKLNLSISASIFYDIRRLKREETEMMKSKLQDTKTGISSTSTVVKKKKKDW